MRPNLKAFQAPIYWSFTFDTSALRLTELPASVTVVQDLSTALYKLPAEIDDNDVHCLYDLGNGQQTHLIYPNDRTPAHPLAILLPLDANGLDRLEAATRLLQSLHGRKPTPDTRLTPQQARRNRHMLQASDGYHNGASYREIADVMFGARRVASEPWKTSALRDATIRLVKDGLGMIAGGYRALLRHRRKE